jgi:catechol 2,3-dioxygenase-like lactoylglutathione lyase family enzyme
VSDSGHRQKLLLKGLFCKGPRQWWKRGDPHLWNEMRVLFESHGLPSTDKNFITALDAMFLELTGVPTTHPEALFIKRLDHGGMTGGWIEPRFWRETLIPLLAVRFAALSSRDDEDLEKPMNAVFKSANGYQRNNLALPVEKLDSSVRYYETYMGFEVISRSESPVRSAILGRDGIQMGLAENGGDPSQDGCAFEVDSVKAALAEFRANGLQKELSDIKSENHGDASWRVFYVVAPDGLCFWFGEKQ